MSQKSEKNFLDNKNNSELIEDTNLESNVELMEHIENKLIVKIQTEKMRIEAFKRIPITILILLLTFVLLILIHAFINPVFAYILSVLGYGIVSGIAVWGTLKYSQSVKNKNDMEETLQKIQTELKNAREKLQLKSINKEEQLVKEKNEERNETIDFTNDNLKEFIDPEESINVKPMKLVRKIFKNKER